MKLFLLGFMGVGKTYLSKIISSHYNLKAFDLDIIIQENQNLSVKDIFEQFGENYFRQKEQECLLQFKDKNNFVLSCGGGTPCFFDNIYFMNQNGLTIWINEDEDIIFKRLKNKKNKRPLIAKLTDEELKNFIKTKNVERHQFYSQALIHTNHKEDFCRQIDMYYAK